MIALNGSNLLRSIPSPPRTSAIALAREERTYVRVSKDEWHQRGLVVLPAIRSIVRRRRGTCHRAALRADPLAPPHHEGRSGPKLSIALQHEIL